MSSFPAELLHNIALSACIDGGKTGCSLALTSKYVREATSRARYQTVALSGQSNIIAFAQLVENIEAFAHIAHLCITSSPTSNRDTVRNDGTNDTEAQDDESTRVESFVVDILRMASPSLRTLFLHITLPTREFYVHRALNFPYPMLENLSLPGFSIPDHDGASLIFPQLKRLNVTAYRGVGRKWRYSLWQRLSVTAPKIETLKLSNFVAAMDVPHFLRVLLDVPLPGPRMIGNQTLAPVAGEGSQYTPGSRQAADAADAAARLPLLRTIYVQPGVYVNSGWCGTGGLAHSTMLVSLISLSRQTQEGKGNGVIHYSKCPTRTQDSEWEEALRLDFLDVVRGLDGPWSISVDQLKGGEEVESDQEDDSDCDEDE